jgi:hypothetical protein
LVLEHKLNFARRSISVNSGVWNLISPRSEDLAGPHRGLRRACFELFKQFLISYFGCVSHWSSSIRVAIRQI